MTILDSRRALVLAHLPVVRKLLRRYPVRFHADLFQEGVVALAAAAERWDSRRSTFGAYARHIVAGCLTKKVARLASIVAVSHHQAERQWAVERAITALSQRRANSADADVARELGWPIDRVASTIATEPRQQVARVEDFRSRATSPEAQLIDREADRLALARLASLGGRKAAIVARSLGILGPAETLAAIGRSLGISSERVRQIRNQALSELRNAITAEGVRGR